MLHNGFEICTCKKSKCIRHGKCEECLAYHNNSKRYPNPYCVRKSKHKKQSKSNFDGGYEHAID